MTTPTDTTGTETTEFPPAIRWNIWDLQANPTNIRTGAASWRNLKSGLNTATDTVNTRAGQITDWQGETATSYASHRSTLTGDSDEAETLAENCAAALDGVASNLELIQTSLDGYLAAVTCEYTVKGTTVTFVPEKQADVTSIDTAISLAEQAREDLDTYLAEAKTKLARYQGEFAVITNAWARAAAGQPTFTVPGEAGMPDGSPEVIRVGDQVIVNTGNGNDTVTVTVDPVTGQRILTVNGVRYEVPPGAQLTVRTGSGHDQISVPRGTNVNLTVLGSGGNDTVDTGAGEQTVLGGSGNDQVSTGDGNDRVYTEAGNDTVDVGNGYNTAVTGAGNDTVRGGRDQDRIRTDDGNDTVAAGAGNDTVHTGAGNDNVAGGAGNDLVTTGEGDDKADGGAGEDTVVTGAGTDTAHGGDGHDVVNTGAGDDFATGGAGDDTIHTGGGNDRVNGVNLPLVGGVEVGAEGDDTINGGAGDDTILGGGGDDVVIPSEGDDNVSGGDGDDVLHGGDDDDTVSAGDGHDVVTGGYGNDTIRGGDGNDIIEGNGGGADRTRSDDDTVRGGDGDDLLSGGAGNDRIYGERGNDVAHGGAGDDYFDGGEGNDFFRGGAGGDVAYGGAGRDTLHGGKGNDYLEGSEGEDSLAGEDGDDILSGGKDDDSMDGGDGNDVFYAGHGQDIVSGGDGNDTAHTQDDGDHKDYANSDVENVVNVEYDPDLGSTIVVDGTDEFKARVLADLEMLRSSPNGQLMLTEQDLLAHGIAPHNPNGLFQKPSVLRITEITDENGYAWTEGDERRIGYNPAFNLGGSTSAHHSPPLVVLYHEMAHTYDYGNETSVPNDYNEPDNPNTPNSEREAVGLPIDQDGDGTIDDPRDFPAHPHEYTENGMLDEFGWPLRPRY